MFRFRPFPYGAYFGLLGIFLGILTAIPVLMLAARVVMGKRRFIEYAHWDEGRNRDAGKECGRGAPEPVGGCPAGRSAWRGRGLPDHELVHLPDGGRGPINCWYWPTREVRPYDTVQEIVVTSHRRVSKEVMKGPDLGLRFSDGRTWRTGGAFHLPHDPDEVKELLDFLRRKTGKPITQARLLDDLPGW